MDPDANNGTIATLPSPGDISPPPSPPTETQPSPGTAGGTAPAPDPELSTEQVTRYLDAHPELHDKYFESKDHEALRKVPAYNKQLARGLAADQKKRDEAAAVEREQQEQYARIDNVFRPVHPDPSDTEAVRTDKALRLASIVSVNPQATMAYAQWQQIKDQGGPAVTRTQRELAEKMVGFLKSAIEADESQSHLLDEWDDIIASDSDPTKVLAKLWETGLKRERAVLTTKAQEEATAKYNALLARRNLSADEPENPAGGITGNGSTADEDDAILTGNASLAEKQAAFQRKHGIAAPIHV